MTNNFLKEHAARCGAWRKKADEFSKRRLLNLAAKYEKALQDLKLRTGCLPILSRRVKPRDPGLGDDPARGKARPPFPRRPHHPVARGTRLRKMNGLGAA